MAHRTYEHVAISQLKNHPLNIEIFGELRPKDVLHDSEFVDSVKDIGILEPVLLTVNKEIIAGHRRRQAAARAGLKEVPCLILRDLGNDRVRINRAWFEANRQREMNTEQKARWGKARLEIEEAEAKVRERAGKGADGSGGRGNKADHTKIISEGLSPAKTGEAMAIVAEEVGMSAPTLRKAIQVTEAIDKAQDKGQEAKAEEIREALNGQSVAAAHRLAVKPKGGKKKQAKPANLVTDIDKAAGQVSRALLKAAQKHGEGTFYDRIFKAIETIKKAVAEWSEAL